MSPVLCLLQMFDDTWSQQRESLRSIPQGVTSEESMWQDPAYAAEPFVQVLPEPGTILWQVAHLEHCARHYTEILRKRPIAREPATPPPGIAELSELINRLERARRLLREEIQRLSEADLDSPCARGMSVGVFVRGVIRHEAWHAGQLAVIRRLYRQRNRSLKLADS
jgi:DinB superfamily